MKFTCDKEALRHALLTVERFAGKNVTLPILGNVLIEAKENNALTLTATNLEFAASLSVSGETNRPGLITVPARVLSALVQSFRGASVVLEAQAKGVLVSSGGERAVVNGLTSEDFPIIPRVKEEHRVSVSGTILRRGFEATAPMVSISEFKPELSGVYVRVLADSVVFVATDTFRLAEKTCPLPSRRGEESFSFIIPHRAAQEAARMFTDDTEVRIGVGEGQAALKSDQALMITRLIDGKFPDYQVIIPRDFNTASHVEKGELMRAIRSSSIFASKLQDVTLHFKDEGELEVLSENPDIGTHRAVLAAATTGPSAALKFNHRYLADGLAIFDGEDLFFGCNSSDTPALIRMQNDSSFLYVLMPIRTT